MRRTRHYQTKGEGRREGRREGEDIPAHGAGPEAGGAGLLGVRVTHNALLSKYRQLLGVILAVVGEA